MADMSVTPTVDLPASYNPDTQITKRPLIFVDLEFTGLAADHEILQIGAIKVRQPDFVEESQWEAKTQPEHIESASKEALEVVGYTEEGWKGAIPLRDALEQFNDFAQGGVLIGFNIVGDFYQLKKSYAQVGLEPTYHWQVLDVLSMLFAQFYDSGLKGFRMRELASHFNIAQRQWHDALADARATYDLFMQITMGNNHV